MATRSWDGPIVPIDPVAVNTINRVLFDRLVDELEVLGLLVHGAGELDRQQLRDQVDQALTVAYAILDLVEPVRAGAS